MIYSISRLRIKICMMKNMKNSYNSKPGKITPFFKRRLDKGNRSDLCGDGNACTLITALSASQL